MTERARALPRGLVVGGAAGALVLCFVLTLATLVIIAQHIAVPYAAPATAGYSRLTIALTLYTCITSYIVLFAFFAVGINDRLERQPSSRLLLPIIIVAGGFAGVLSILALRSLDRLFHDEHPRWTFLNDPDVTLLVLVLFATIALGMTLKVRPLIGAVGLRDGQAWELLVAGNLVVIGLVTMIVLVV